MPHFIPILVEKTIDVEVTCNYGHQHIAQQTVTDWDAYWALDYMGAEDPQGGFYYTKAAYPRLSDAQLFHRQEKLRVEAERSFKPRPRRKKTNA